MKAKNQMDEMPVTKTENKRFVLMRLSLKVCAGASKKRIAHGIFGRNHCPLAFGNWREHVLPVPTAYRVRLWQF